MRTTPQSPRSRFPKSQPHQSENHAPTPTPRRTPHPHRPSRTPRRRGGSRTARPAAAGPSPPNHKQPRHTPHLHRRSRERGNPGQGRGAGRLRPPSHPPLPIARALPDTVRPEPVEGPHRHQHPPPPRTPPSSYLRKPVSRGARRGAPPPKPPSHPPLPIARALPESVRPEPVEGPLTTSNPRHTPHPPIVVPANAGIQGRGAARGVSVPHRIPHSPPHTRLPNPFALSLSKGPSPPATPATPHTPPSSFPRTLESRAGARRGASPSSPS